MMILSFKLSGLIKYKIKTNAPAIAKVIAARIPENAKIQQDNAKDMPEMSIGLFIFIFLS